MESLSQYACKVANRVALGMRFGEASGHRDGAQQIVRESVNLTCDLLDRIDPVELQQWFEQFHVVYLKSHRELIGDRGQWSRFLGTQCDALHRLGLHQKTIAVVGDELAKWNRQPVSFTDFANSLDGLADLVSKHAKKLSSAIEFQAGKETKFHRRTEWFSNAVNGLAITLVSIQQAIESGDPRDSSNAAIGSFAAALTTDSVTQLYGACDLKWV